LAAQPSAVSVQPSRVSRIHKSLSLNFALAPTDDGTSEIE
jgi:hypothetical protein